MAFKIKASILNLSAITASLTLIVLVSVTLAIPTFAIIPNSIGENNHLHGLDNQDIGNLFIIATLYHKFNDEGKILGDYGFCSYPRYCYCKRFHFSLSFC